MRFDRATATPFLIVLRATRAFAASKSLTPSWLVPLTTCRTPMPRSFSPKTRTVLTPNGQSISAENSLFLMLYVEPEG